MSNGRGREQEKKGCGRHLLVGCGTLLVLVLVAVTVAYTYYKSKVTEYTSPTPAYLPEVTMEREAINSLTKRVGEYGKSLRAGTASQPLSLSENEINALIQTGEAARGLSDRVYVRPEGEKLSVDFSFPLDGIVPMGEGRYLNGTAVMDVAIENGMPVVRIESAETNDREIPDWVMDKLEEQLPLDRIASRPNTAAVLQGIQSVEVKNGQLVITPKTR
jgi:hypothetical protein